MDALRNVLTSGQGQTNALTNKWADDLVDTLMRADELINLLKSCICNRLTNYWMS